jgi:hypothetical protein
MNRMMIEPRGCDFFPRDAICLLLLERNLFRGVPIALAARPPYFR